MITINGHKYAKTQKEFMASLFTNRVTCRGYYKITKNGLSLMNHQKNKIECIPFDLRPCKYVKKDLTE